MTIKAAKIIAAANMFIIMPDLLGPRPQGGR